MSDVTRTLTSIEQGDSAAADQLLPLVYDELRRLAAAKLAHERPGQTLSATALVHEAYMRLVDINECRQWNGRTHFFAAAAEAMRRILVDRARQKTSQKRGGARVRVEFREEVLDAPEDCEEILAVHDALDALAATDSQAAQLVKLRYFAGLSIDETAGVLNISPRSADRLWSYARVWLQRAIAGTGKGAENHEHSGQHG
jgi:RNA polymerase sigma factor (TIGR02999 family)